MYERVLHYCCCCEGGDRCEGGVGVSIREQRSSSRFRRGGVSKNQIAVATAARLFFLTAVAIAIATATRPFKFREISVSNSTRSFVSSIHSLDSDTSSLFRYRINSTANPKKSTKEGKAKSQTAVAGESFRELL